jgi:type IX secretion system PorP/SprF family membrane protein
MKLKLKTAIFSICFIFIYINKIYAQDPDFSQFFADALYYNPAEAGSAGLPRLFLHYRNQYPSLGNAFVTYNASYDQPSKNIEGGWGINFLSDVLGNGSMINSSADFIYAHKFKVSRKFSIQAGLQVSLLFHSLNASKFTVFTDNFETINSNLTTQPDFSIGAMALSRDDQIGLACNHLNTGYARFNYNYISFPIKLTFYAIHNFHIYNQGKINNNEFIISPGVLIENQAQSTMINAGCIFTKNELSVGIWLRDILPLQFNSTIFSLSYMYNNIKLTYSYDYDLRYIAYNMSSTGAHELSLVMLFTPDPKRKRYGPISCPDIHQ